ncbi:MAG: hypothetical protein DMF77_17855 [Acidobacteria bacterium]|nr:MAG: hypothetical protein DMF77_17855 [Acidobacteriota bacterium]
MPWLGVAFVLLLSLPALLGGVVLILVRMWPSHAGPDTALNRAFVAFLEGSIVLPILSLPTTLLAMAVGVWATWRGGMKTAHGKVVAVVLVVAIVSTVAYFVSFNSVMRGLAHHQAGRSR